MRSASLKKISAVIALTMMALYPTNFATAAAKSGALCNKKGATQVVGNVKFTCILKLKKLVWDTGLKIKIPTNNSSPSAKPAVTTETQEFVPWASKFDYTLMVNSALKKTSEYFGVITPSSKYEITIDSAFKSDDKILVNKVLSHVNGAFSKFGFDSRKVFLGTTHEWGAAILKSNNLWLGDPRSPFACSDGTRDAMCAQGNLILLIYSDIYGGKGTFGWDYGRVSVPAHEFFHTVQAYLSSENGIGNQNIEPSPATLPVWLDEGSANFVGFFITHDMKLVDYFYARNNQITNNQNYKTIIPLSDYFRRGNTADGKDFLDPYGIGQAATEYLVASVGFKPIVDIYKNYQSSKNFPTAFKEAVGIEITDFYTKFEAARSSMRISS